MPFPDRLPISRMRGGKLAPSPQQIRQDAAALPNMGNNEYCPDKIRRKRLRYRTQSIQTARGAADDYDVTTKRNFGAVGCHIALPSTQTRRTPKPMRATGLRCLTPCRETLFLK